MPPVALIESLFAGAVVLVCAVLLVRQFMSAPRRQGLDAAVVRSVRRLRAVTRALWRWPAARRSARREAEAAIQRAQHAAFDREGNVYRPRSMRKPRKLH